MNKDKPQKKSSKMVKEFLDKTGLHKKEFAKMIGVTLSYVYNLIDENVPFTARSITLERIATVMGINPEDFIEYQIPPETPTCGDNLIMLKDLIKFNNLTNLEFLKMFKPTKRIELVDILRGAKPVWIDFEELKKIASALKLDNEGLFEMWKKRMFEYLESGGFNLDNNKELLDVMFESAGKKIITKS